MESAARAGTGTRTQIARSLRARERGKVTSAAIPMVQVIVGAPDHCVSSCLTPLPLGISLLDLSVSPRAVPVTWQYCAQGVVCSTSSHLILSSPAQIIVVCANDWPLVSNAVDQAPHAVLLSSIAAALFEPFRRGTA
jgi:hypothetical protein